MKHIIALLSLLLLSAASSAQDLSVLVNISPNPSNHLSDWTSRKNTVTITFVNIRTIPAICRAEATLSLNGELIAATRKSMSAPITIAPGSRSMPLESVFPLSSFDLIGEKAKLIQRSGILPEGNYELCINITELGTSNAISGPMEIRSCGNTYVHAPNIPVILSPADGSLIHSGDLVNIVWTPDPTAPTSTYKIDLYETPGSKSSQPITEKKTTGNSIVIPANELKDRSTSALPMKEGKKIEIVVQKDEPNSQPSVPTHVIIIPDTIPSKKIAAIPDTVKKVIPPAVKPRVVPGSPADDSSAISGTAASAQMIQNGSVTEVIPNDEGHEPKWQIWGNTIYIGGSDAETGEYESAQFTLPDSLFGNGSYLSQIVTALLKDKPEFPHVCPQELATRCGHGELVITWGRIVSVLNQTMTQTIVKGEAIGNKVEEHAQTTSVTMDHFWSYDCKTGKFTRRFIFQTEGSKDGKAFKVSFYKDFETRDPDC